MKELVACFKELKRKFPGYEDRPQQLEMAEEVFACLSDKERLLIEAGTGVGKTFAYLIPAVLSKEKTIVSTASIALQDQLVNKDLVILKKLLPHDFSFAILKGKNNYLCLKREREFVETGEAYNRFREWMSRTATGDKDEIPFIPDFWYRVCGDSDDCSGKECPSYNDCFYYRHYRSVQKVDILVVNHHLLLYDLLSEFNLLPFHNQLIIDEAHQIENVISHVLGAALSRSRVLWLLYRLKGFKIAVEHLYDPVESFFKGKGLQPPLTISPFAGEGEAWPFDSAQVCPEPGRRGSPEEERRGRGIPQSIVEGLQELRGLLSLNKVIRRLKQHQDAQVVLSMPDPADPRNDLSDRAETTINYVKALARDIDDFIAREDEERVYYTGWNRGYLELRSNLVEARLPFDALLKGYEGLVMTSATLTTGGDFSFLKERLGITGFRERVIGSPFDYKRQALLYIDKGLPYPSREKSDLFQRESLKSIEGLINVSRGRALVLFTSYNHLNYAARSIRIDYPFKAQGEMPPARLIEWFKETPNSVLLATATFWQGIDIRGEKLSLVVIVKMPFGSPGDPVYEERCRRLKDRWFADLALPSAILLLRQGFGRLIRSIDDRGVVAILDSRIANSSYGKTVLASLPEMEIVHNVDEVKRFFNGG